MQNTGRYFHCDFLWASMVLMSLPVGILYILSSQLQNKTHNLCFPLSSKQFELNLLGSSPLFQYKLLLPQPNQQPKTT